MVNSGHRRNFIKSVVLKSLTRFKYIKHRSLPADKKEFRPMYRHRGFEYEEKTTWYEEKTSLYNGKNYGDLFKQNSKARINRKRSGATDFSTVMFVPSSEDGKLIKKLEDLQQNRRERK